MLTATEARAKTDALRNTYTFDEALAVIEQNVNIAINNEEYDTCFMLDVLPDVAKKLKEHLKRLGYKSVSFEEYSFAFVVSFRW